MASRIDVSDLTLNEEEAQDVGSIVLEREFINGVLSEDHTIETGIHHKQQIVFGGKIEDSLKKSTGCTPNEGGDLKFTEKFWDPEMFDTRFVHCSADMNKLLKIFAKALRVNPDFYDRIDSQELGLVAARVGMMLRETLPKKIWFSNRTAEVAPGGSFKEGTDLDLYNVFDGLWKQVLAEINSSNGNYLEISENQGASYADQVLAEDAAFDLFEKMLEEADERLLEDPSAKFYVTRSLSDNYRKTLRKKTLGAGFIEVTENGKTQLLFDGYRVDTKYVWDRTIKGSQNNGTKWNLPHRTLFTTPDNIPVGTVATEDFEALDSFYDRTLKSNIMDVAFSLDTKFLEDYMAVAAY